MKRTLDIRRFCLLNSPGFRNTWLYIPALMSADRKKRFVCVCLSSEKAPADDPDMFMKALKERLENDFSS